MLEIKSNYSQKAYDLVSKIDDFTAENKKLKNLMESLQTANTSLEEQNEDLSKKLADVILFSFISYLLNKKIKILIWLFS